MRGDRDFQSYDLLAIHNEAQMLLRRWREESARDAPPIAKQSPDDTLVVQFGRDEIVLSSRLIAQAGGPGVQYQFPAQRSPRERRFKTPDGKKFKATDANYFFSSER